MIPILTNFLGPCEKQKALVFKNIAKQNEGLSRRQRLCIFKKSPLELVITLVLFSNGFINHGGILNYLYHLKFVKMEVLLLLLCSLYFATQSIMRISGGKV